MHEMSIIAGMLDIIKQEMQKHTATKLIKVRVRHGSIAGVVPESLELGFEVLTSKNEFAGAVLELEQEALRLACGSCGAEFSPEPSKTSLFTPCTACGEEIGHTVLAGKALYIENIEIE